MKLGDLRKQLRWRPAVDELDDFLIEKGTMSAPEVRTVEGSDGNWTVIVDDSLKSTGTAVPPAYRDEVLGDWTEEPSSGLPPSLHELTLAKTNVLVKLGQLTDRPGFVGSHVYDSTVDELCQIKYAVVEPSGAPTEFDVWHGARDKYMQPVIQRVSARRLHPVTSKRCETCTGYRGRSYGRPPAGKCPKCNGLEMVPTTADMKAFRKPPEGAVFASLLTRREVDGLTEVVSPGYKRVKL